MKTMAYTQRGFSFGGFLIVAALLIFVAIAGMKVGPAYIQNAEIKSILDAIAHDPEMQVAPVKAVREAFSKRAMMNNISTVRAEDVEIAKEGNNLTLSISYQVKIPVAGNASLLLDFNNTTAK